MIRNYGKKILIILSVLIVVLVVGEGKDIQAAGKTYNLGQGWTMRLDTPGMDSKPYYHIHFYYKKAAKYCLRLDTLQPCDGYKKNSVPNGMIDLREKEDYEKGHIKEFINIPSSEGKEVVEYIQANNLKNKSIYLMCYSGKRAAKAINLLRSKGCRKLVYITFGYEKFANSQNDFVPKVGRCDCLAD